MKRALPYLLLSVCLILIGTQRVSAATWDAGSLEGVRDSVVITHSTVGGTGSLEWAWEATTSTYTGLVHSFSIVAKADHAGATVAMTGTLIDANTGLSGSGYVNYGDVCDVSENINVTSTECIVTFNLDVPVMVTSSNPVWMTINTYNQFTGNVTTYYASVKPRDSSWIWSRMHLAHAPTNQWTPWDSVGGSYTDNQLAWAWNYDPNGCAVNCNSNILFLPGSPGSRLYSDTATSSKLWEPEGDLDVKDLYLDITGTSTLSDIYTKDVIDEFDIWFAPDLNIYKSFLEDLEDWKNTSTQNLIADYAVVPYDWRLSLDDILRYGRHTTSGNIYYSGDQRTTSTPYIIEQLRTLAQTSRTGKVTIIVHSYGGLVAKALMKLLEDTDDPLLSKIDNLVLVASPQLGTPHAIGSALHGYDTGIFGLFSDEVGRTFASTSPMAYSLLPSDNYFEDYGAGGLVLTPPVTFESGSATQPYIDEYGSEITTFAELSNFLLDDEIRAQPPSNDLSTPSILDWQLLTYAESMHWILDPWTPPTSTNVYQVAGWGLDTLSSIKYETANVEGNTFIFPNPQIVIDGDDTVVIPSALAMSTSTENVSRWWLNLSEYNEDIPWYEPNRVHKDIFEVDVLRDFIKNYIVTHSTTTPPQFITGSEPTSGSSERLHFFLHSPLALSAHDKMGREISATTSTLPRALYKRFGEVQYISLPSGSFPQLKLTGFASGLFTLDINEVIGNNIIASTTFSGLPTTTTTRARMDFIDGKISGASPLRIDMNGDGLDDLNLAAKLGEKVYLDPVTKRRILDDFTHYNE
jgi:pimeloyl-ACP methyl ester carboxylesterase